LPPEHFAEPLPSNDREIHIQTHRLRREGFMKYAIEMDSRAMIYIPNFIKNGSGVQKLIGGGQTHRQGGDLISLPLFLQNKKSRLQTVTVKGSYNGDLCNISC
jgi:hypothetical protein